MLDTIALPIEVRHIILILLSCFSGFIIGYERKSKHKQAGRKTHILVALTATFYQKKLSWIRLIMILLGLRPKLSVELVSLVVVLFS